MSTSVLNEDVGAKLSCMESTGTLLEAGLSVLV